MSMHAMHNAFTSSTATDETESMISRPDIMLMGYDVTANANAKPARSNQSIGTPITTKT